jgi:hypothetical protein
MAAAIALMVQAANAQNEISMAGFENKGRSKVKVCIYAGAAELNPLAQKCVSLEPGSIYRWDRGEFTVFSVFAFDPGVIDKIRCTQKTIVDPATIQIFEKDQKTALSLPLA